MALVSQVIHLSSSSRVSLRDINSITSVRLSISSRGNTLSISSSIARTANQEEVSSRGRIIKHLVFLPQQPTRVVKQPLCKEEAKDAFIVKSRAIGQCIVRRRWLNCSRPNAPARHNAPQQGADNRIQTRYNHGRLNHMEAKAFQETPGMIAGTFPVESHLVEVLFDTGATHSFIIVSWVEAHNLPITTMTTPIQIDSAGGKVQADSVCLNVSVETGGSPSSYQL
jgi:hypothetical protein